MIKKLLICALIFITATIFAMEEREAKPPEEKSTMAEERAFKVLITSYLDKLPIEIRKKIEDYLLFEKIPTEIKELIAKTLVNRAANIQEARQAGKDLRNLSQVNREFRAIVNNKQFTDYVIGFFVNKLKIDAVYAGALLATPKAVEAIKKLNLKPSLFNWLLFDMVNEGNLVGIKFLFDVGATLEKKDYKYKGSQVKPYDLLVDAANKDDERILKFLLSKNPNREDTGIALIHLLSTTFSSEEEKIKNTVQILIDAGADVNLIDSNTGWSTLKIAKRRNLNEIAKMLEAAGAKYEK